MLRKAPNPLSCCFCCCCGDGTRRLLLPHRVDNDESDCDDDDDSAESDSDEEACPPDVLVRELGEAAPLGAGLGRTALRNARRLARAVQSGVAVLFITGAGVSVASGIRTFRTGADGLWNNFIYEVCFSVFVVTCPWWFVS